MNWYLVIKFLHILAVTITVGGMFARQLVRGVAKKSDDVKTVASLTQVVIRIDRGMVIPWSNIMIVVGIILAVMMKWPIFGFLQGEDHNWLLVSNTLLIIMLVLIPAVFIPHNKKVESILQTALAEGRVTPELTASLSDKTNALAHHAEETIILIVAALMVLKPFKMTAILETKRLLLRHQTIEDLDALWALYCNPNITKYIPDAPRSREEAKEELEWHMHGHPKYPELGLWATIHKETDKFIGRCGLLPWTIEGQNEVEVAYTLAQEYWGQGLATEGAQGILQYGFEKLNLSRLICLIDPENIASQRVAEKIGMTLEKKVDGYEGDNIPFYVYSINKFTAVQMSLRGASPKQSPAL